MFQAVMTTPGVIEYNSISIPEPNESQVLIKVSRIGICGSDIHVFHGKHPFTSYPVVQGHEVSGEVIKTGGGVNGFNSGDIITVQPQVVCNHCYSCRNGRYNICDNLKVMGFQTTGLASEYAVIDADKLLKLPQDIDLDKGALIEPVAVAVHAVRKAENIKGKKVLVLGAGPIGNLVAQVAKGMGAATVMITDVSNHRLDIAMVCGIEHCINTLKENLSCSISDIFGFDKADVIFECVGLTATIQQAVENARKGSEIVVVGVFGDKAEIDFGLIQDRELYIMGTLMYTRSDFDKAIELVSNGRIRLEPLISRHFKFEEYIDAYRYIEEHKDRVMKVIIEL